MATIVKWNGFSFAITKSKIVGLKDFDVSVSVETDKKTAGSENYQKKKNLDPTKITMVGVFSMALGVKDVRATAYKLVDMCRKAESGYIYVGSAKLMPPKFMGTSAKIQNIQWLSDGRWSYAEVNVTLEQCEKYGGGTKGEKSSKKKSSKKKSSKGSGKGKDRISTKGGSGGTSGKGFLSKAADAIKGAQAKETVKKASDWLKSTKKQSKYTPTRYGTGSQKTSGKVVGVKKVAGAVGKITK